ncbi:geranylgeranyl diphosphate reductase [Catellatospora sp. IY07-71]|uniref:FAD-dependent monooxygenase n=1 Tax=Catellatospora sp. IY07-71 TaxID=2728827 RepID=UPI001BB36B97|nr:FAD-dependent monooxygenase [Catellatospora sp. IY07-71]BCJ73417.1 geranylgeranyl diphosphate reductase [Catellatospora sp. IY07-71]
MYDIAIVGAGPAGSAAALAAARLGARVLLLDRADFPRDKACGDGIAPQALAVAARLGVTGLADGFTPVGSLALAGPGGARVARELPEPAYVIPREVFDARLVAAAVAAGAELRRHTVRELVVHRDCVVLGGGLAARVVVGADGANSTVRRLLGVPRNPAGALAVAVRAYAPMPTGAGAPPGTAVTGAGALPLRASPSGTADPAVEPGGDDGQRIVMAGGSSPAYAWSFPIGDGLRNVGYGELTATGQVSRTRLLERMHELLGDTDPAGLSLARAHHLPLSTRRPAPGHGRVLLAGDALSLINPFTGEGIFYALVSGELAGHAAVTPGGARAGAAYARALRQRLGRHLRHTAAVAWLTARPWLVDAGIRAAARDRRIFDGLVGLGLGDGLLSPRLLGAVARAAVHRTR